MPISKSNFIFVKDINRVSGTGTSLSYTHEPVKQNTTYEYALDAYDSFGNRSPLSEVKSIVAGDFVAPGPITGTSYVAGYKSIEYRWINPIDVDFTGCYIYSNASKTPPKLHEIGGLTPGSVMKKVFTTGADLEEKDIYITTFDHNRNESITPVRIHGQALAAPSGGWNVTDTITLSLVGSDGKQYNADANLSKVISPMVLNIQTSTVLNVTASDLGIWVYIDDSGEYLRYYGAGSITLEESYTGYKRYTRLMNFGALGVGGKGYIKILARDANDAQIQQSMPVFFDIEKPTITSLIIDNGGAVTNDRAIDIKLVHSDGNLGISPEYSCGISSYQISTTNVLGNNWEAVAATSRGTLNISYTLPNVEKTYNIYGWVKDNAGNTSNAKAPDSGQTIKYNQAQGIDGIVLSVVAANGMEWQKNAYLSAVTDVSPITIHVQCSTALDVTDSNYGVFCYDKDGNNWATGDTLTTITNATRYKLYSTASISIAPVAGKPVEGKGYIRLRAKDSLGRELQDSMSIFIDRTIPRITSIVVDDGRTQTNNRTIYASAKFDDGTTDILGVNASGVEAYQLSTTNSIGNNWFSVGTSVGHFKAPYSLPEVEKIYTIYGWVKDKAGNISVSVTSNTIEYIKLKYTPTGSVNFFTTGGVQLSPNQNGWFNQNVRITYKSSLPAGYPTGMSITKIYYRTSTNGAWNSWILVSGPPLSGGPNGEVTINIDVSTEGTTDVEFYAINSQNESGGNISCTVKIDKTNPSMTKASFWNLTKTENINRESCLFWNISGSDSISGLWKTYIYRGTTNNWLNSSTVESTDINRQWVIDDDDSLVTGKTYYYWGRFSDRAGNLSSTSDPKSLMATYDWEYEYRNWISNGSFERTTVDGANIKVLDWKYQDGIVSGNTPYAVGYQEGYYGTKSLYIFYFSYIPIYNLHIPEDKRIFTASYWIKSQSSWTTNGHFVLKYYKPDNTLLKSVSLTITPQASWTQQYWNFISSAYSGWSWNANSAIPVNAGYMTIGFLGDDADGYTNMWLVDGVQWEEGRVPTKFIDNQAINTQRLNAGIIDANHIRVNSITANLIKANTITAAQIAANTITASQIAADTITASQIAANAITASEINALAVTAGKIAANAVTATEIAANAVTADKIISNAITSTKIATEGLIIKSGGMASISIGDPTGGVNSEFIVGEYNGTLGKADLYFKPRGYTERWHFTKHIENQKHDIAPGSVQTWERNFLAEDGLGYSPKILTTPVYMLTSSPSSGQIMKFSYAQATSQSFVINEAVLLRGNNIIGVNHVSNLTCFYTTPATFTMLVSSGAPVWVTINVPWSQPTGTLQRVSYQILTSRDNVTFYSNGNFQQVYKGVPATVSYYHTLIHHINQGAKYVKVNYFQRTPNSALGPASINLYEVFNWDIDQPFTWYTNLKDKNGATISAPLTLFHSHFDVLAIDGFLSH